MAKTSIKIKISLDGDDIIIHNDDAPDNNIRIGGDDKTIKAIDIYKLLNFKDGNEYEIEHDEIGENQSPVKDYYDDVVDLLKQITDEINGMEILYGVDTPKDDAEDMAERNIVGPEELNQEEYGDIPF